MLETIIYCSVGAVVLIAALVFISKLYNASLVKKGVYGIKSVQKIMNKGAKSKGYRVLGNVSVEHNGKIMNFESVLVGPFGIILADSFSENGDYYGDGSAENWVKVAPDGKRTTLPNYSAQSERNIVTLRELFSKNNIYKVPIEYYTIVTRSAKKFNVCITSAPSLIDISNFRKMLRKSKYTYENNVPVDKICEVLTAKSEG